MKHRRPLLVLFAQLAIVVAAAATLAGVDHLIRGPKSEAYPNRAIKVIVPFGEGGSTDTFARTIKRAIDEDRLLPQPFVIINQEGKAEGGGTAIGCQYVKDAEPDGYTMLILHDTLFTAKALKMSDFGAEAFQPIAGTGETAMVLAARKNSPYKNLNDLMDAVASRPNEIVYANNHGALVEFAALHLENQYAEKHATSSDTPPTFRYVQAGGGANRYADLIGGQADITGFSIDEFIRFSGDELQGLAFFGDERHPALPNIPTAREQGYDIIIKNVYYWWFPKETPLECVNVLGDVLEKAMATPSVRQYMSELHSKPLVLRDSKLRRRIAKSEATYTSVATSRESPLPNVAGILISVVTVLIGFVFIQTMSLQAKERAAWQDQVDFTPRFDLATICLFVTLLYAGVLTSRLVDFRIVTAGYLFIVGSVLTKQKHARLIMMAVAVMLAVVLFYAFTELFVVDLP